MYMIGQGMSLVGRMLLVLSGASLLVTAAEDLHLLLLVCAQTLAKP